MDITDKQWCAAQNALRRARLFLPTIVGRQALFCRSGLQTYSALLVSSSVNTRGKGPEWQLLTMS
jgi:hypothetical protein